MKVYDRAYDKVYERLEVYLIYPKWMRHRFLNLRQMDFFDFWGFASSFPSVQCYSPAWFTFCLPLAATAGRLGIGTVLLKSYS